MRAVDLIQKKRDGQELTSSEIEWLVEGYVLGTVPDYQMSAFAMAVYFKGMTTREISDLTIVIQKKQGAPSAKSKMEDVFGNCEIVKKDKGYYILRSVKE